MLGYGDGWREILHKSGHEYLVLLVPLVLAMLAVAVGLFVAEARDLSRDPRARAPIRPPSFVRPWLLGFLVLCSVYALQETCEGLLSGEHAAGFTGLLANGGWIAFALAVAGRGRHRAVAARRGFRARPRLACSAGRRGAAAACWCLQIFGRPGPGLSAATWPRSAGS